MAKFSNGCVIVVALIGFLAMLSRTANGQLSSTFYSSTCPNLQSIVRSAMTQAVNREKRIGASILRLFFHDCFVNGCDGSILLDDTSSFTGEKTAGPNNNSVRGFDVIDTIKTNVESACPSTVSCADILALAARDGVVLLGGPTWTVLLGRRDATTASLSTANSDLPSPASSLAQLISAFSNKGLNARDLTALSGGHTIGQSRCVNFRAHIYNDANIDSAFATSRQANCPSASGSSDDNLAPLDLQTPVVFDNDYYKNLVVRKGLLHSDQELFNNGSQDSLVRQYSNNNAAFSNDFTAAMIKMGNISPLTGTSGQIRVNCRKVNG
ncbi:peroxidase P7-like [Zingiber officinale]|uniref:peroxidase P7-like n=1 Tax=Zingiber officinale TaxID=94328 RepID=UPI001C4D4CF3|nr:peroxidase P7-like [Zingiber officinale]